MKQLLEAIQRQDTSEVGRLLMLHNSSKEMGQEVFELFKAVSRMTASSVITWAMGKSPEELIEARERIRRGEDL